MSRKPYSRKLRQLKYLSRQYELLGATASIKKAAIERKMLLLARQLVIVLGRKVIKPILPVALGVMLGFQVDAQSFKDPVSNPFGAEFSGESAFAPVMVDIDNDGDLDMFIAGYENAYAAYGGLFYYENVGTAQSPEFTDPRVNPFGIDGLVSPIIEMGDLDGDGDIDLIHYVDYDPGKSEMNFVWVENAGTAEQPNFLTVSPLDLAVQLPPDIGLIQLADMDDDGDMDIICGTRAYNYATYYYDNYMAYFENVGTPESFDFAFVNTDIFNDQPFISTLLLSPAVGDIDNDGDIDILSTLVEYDYSTYTLASEFRFYENMDSQVPEFAASTRNPFGLKQQEFFILPDLCDLDGDGDLDIMATAYDYINETIELFFFENEDVTSNSYVDAIDLGWKLMPNPVSDQAILDIGSDIDLTEDQLLTIFDQSGKMVRQININTPKQEIDFSMLSNGTYYMQTLLEGKRVQLSFVVVR